MIVRADIEIRFGKSTVNKWVGMDDEHQSARVDAAIDWAYAQIAARLKGIPYDETHAFIEGIAIDLAGWRLYSSRGLDGADDNKNEYEHVRKEAFESLMNIKLGSIYLGTEESASTIPQVGEVD